MTEKDDLVMKDLVMKVERLEIENKRLTSLLKIANKEIDKCHKAIERYEQMIDTEVEHICRHVRDMKTFGDTIQKLYEQGK